MVVWSERGLNCFKRQHISCYPQEGERERVLCNNCGGILNLSFRYVISPGRHVWLMRICFYWFTQESTFS